MFLSWSVINLVIWLFIFRINLSNRVEVKLNFQVFNQNDFNINRMEEKGQSRISRIGLNKCIVHYVPLFRLKEKDELSINYKVTQSCVITARGETIQSAFSWIDGFLKQQRRITWGQTARAAAGTKNTQLWSVLCADGKLETMRTFVKQRQSATKRNIGHKLKLTSGMWLMFAVKRELTKYWLQQWIIF